MGSTATTGSAPETLRAGMVEHIKETGHGRTSSVREAMLTVPRHEFVPGTTIEDAYADIAVITKRDAQGSALSCASVPTIVAMMLDQLDVRPGHRTLEIGAGTGYNAPLLAHLTRPSGHVTTIDIDPEVTAHARRALDATGYGHVRVITRDGGLGDPQHQPYDRIIVTVGAWDIPPPWRDQLTPGGRLVVPLRFPVSGLTRSIAFKLEEPGRMVGINAAVCGFVPMRGAAEMSEGHVRLADDVILKLDADDLPDEAALAQALTYPASEQWTGLQARHDEPAEHLDLWLATTNNGASFGRLSVGTAARAIGLVNPAVRWAGATLYDGGTITYLAARAHTDETNELGVIAHGPDSSKLAGQTNDLLDRWSQERPARPIITAYPAGTPGDQLSPGLHIARPDTSLTIAW